ncbi:MAG: rhodanese-like domain-containing protein [Pseudomonadota bacterium]
MSWHEIYPDELNRRIRHGEDWTIIDVREPEERVAAKITNTMHIRMSDIPARLADIPAAGKVAFLCHAGVRSQHVCDYLTNRGIVGTYSVVGGIDRWSTDVDPDIPRY